MENFAGLAWRSCKFSVKIGIYLAVSSVVIVAGSELFVAGC
jgi:hypothetical protein